MPAWWLPGCLDHGCGFPGAHTHPTGTQLCWAWPWGSPGLDPGTTAFPGPSPNGRHQGLAVWRPSHAPCQRGWALWPFEPACPPHHRLGLHWEGCCPSPHPQVASSDACHRSRWRPGAWSMGRGEGSRLPDGPPGGRSGGSHVPLPLSSPASPIFMASGWPSSQAPVRAGARQQAQGGAFSEQQLLLRAKQEQVCLARGVP